MNYYMGIDGGGSKTYVLIADERGRIVGTGASGNGNHQMGYETARRSIADAVGQALSEAGIGRERIAKAFFGLAGADREADFRILRPMLDGLGLPAYDVDCDTIIALRAGTDRPYGVVLICGTGTNCAGRDRRGRTIQCGGFGYNYGDFGGGGMLNIEAFRAVIRSWEWRERPTRMTDMMLAEWGYASMQELFDDFLDHEKTPPLDTVKLLFRAAGEGDGVARDILRRQGEELGITAAAVIRRLGMESETFDVVLAGSVIARGEGDYVSRYIEQAVGQAARHAQVVRLRVEPVVGALWLAMESEGRPLPPEAFENLRTIGDFAALRARSREGA